METPPADAALVFAPSVTLTITVEGEAPGAEVHLHAGGQGFWIAQLMAELGARVCMASPFGGEPGAMLRAAIEEAGIGVRAVDMAGANGVSIHDRRDGDLEEIVDVPAKPLTRHEVDELYGAALVEALGTRVCVLAGAAEPPVAAANLYERYGPMRPEDVLPRLPERPPAVGQREGTVADAAQRARLPARRPRVVEHAQRSA